MNTMQGFNFFKNFKNNQFCYYRTTLNTIERKTYDKLREGFLSYSKSIQIFGVSTSQVWDIFEKVKQDNTWLFYVKKISYQYVPVGNSGVVIPEYRFSKDEINATLLAIINKCTSITANLSGKSDVEKEIEIHNFFCRNIYYDNSFVASSFECVGPLLFGKGVCEGVSKAVKLLCDFSDIESLLVCGKSMQQQNAITFSSDLHAWNIVKIEGLYHHLDVTFDLTIQALGIVRYDYLNLSDIEISRDHKILSFPIPECPEGNSYYKANGLFMQTQNEYREFLIKNIKKRQKDIVFMLPWTGSIDIAKNRIMSITSDVLSSPFIFFSQYQLISNDSQYVFHLHLN